MHISVHTQSTHPLKFKKVPKNQTTVIVGDTRFTGRSVKSNILQTLINQNIHKTKIFEKINLKFTSFENANEKPQISMNKTKKENS